MPPDITTDDLLTKVVDGLVALPAIKDQGNRIEAELKELNGNVREQGNRITVLETWREVQGEPSAKSVPELRIEVAKVAAQAGGIGAVALIVLFVLKNLGVF